LKTGVASTVSENLMPKVHNLYGQVCYVRRQNSCDEFYKVVGEVRWTTKLSCKLGDEFWCQKLLKSDNYSSTYSQ